MKRGLLLVAVAVLILAVVVVLALASPARALPEYSSQTGEPCATCHISPSGGGIRSPRGQAWLGSHRPGTVPALSDALALLGVHLTVSEADFVAPANAARPASKPAAPTAEPDLYRWLNSYEGN
jgi:hypothetical protein